MLQFASSGSSAEYKITKAESMIRRNHLHDEMRWRAVGMVQAGARQSAVTRELNVHRSAIHRLWNHHKRDRKASRRRGSGRPENYYNGRRSLPAAMCQTRRRRTLTARQLASQLSAAAGRPYPAQLCRAKELIREEGTLRKLWQFAKNQFWRDFLASRSEKTESSMNYDRCISCNATRAKSQELKYFRFPKDEESRFNQDALENYFSQVRRMTILLQWTSCTRTRMLLAELMFAMCGNANYEPDDNIILESTKSSRKQMKIA
ncbi:hypothetical protein AVEN_57579-1 [Araneus ventricosus]|uniref:Transposase Tc1-like domain-containing protein n=1 Tax=Araneus ventricosus TaxID=182803 RepID=A0A4Y2P7B4_ARAVE|nr:hypothetical protein AVEN_57579-1 [Araneus ventricosus]